MIKHLALELRILLAVVDAFHLIIGISTVAYLSTETCGLAWFLFISILVVNIIIACDILLAEVEHQRRIERHSAKTCLEVQMRTCAASGVSSKSYGFAGTNQLILLNKVFRHVRVDCLQSVVVTYHNIVAITTALISHDAHLAAERSTNGVAYINLYVKSLVVASPAPSEVACHHPARRRHTEMAQVDAVAVGHFGCAVSVFVVPTVIELGCRRFHFLSGCDISQHDRIHCFHFSVDGSLSGKKVLSHDLRCRNSK